MKSADFFTHKPPYSIKVSSFKADDGCWRGICIIIDSDGYDLSEISTERFGNAQLAAQHSLAYGQKLIAECGDVPLFTYWLRSRSI